MEAAVVLYFLSGSFTAPAQDFRPTLDISEGIPSLRTFTAEAQASPRASRCVTKDPDFCIHSRTVETPRERTPRWDRT